MRGEPVGMRHFTFVEAARLLGVSPMDVRLMVEEGRLPSVRRAGMRVISEEELEAARSEAAESAPGGGVAPPLQVVLARLEEKAAELADVRRELDHARNRHAEELRALRREVRELREVRRNGGRPVSGTGREGGMRRSLGPLFGVDAADEDGDG